MLNQNEDSFHLPQGKGYSDELTLFYIAQVIYLAPLTSQSCQNFSFYLRICAKRTRKNDRSEKMMKRQKYFTKIRF